MRGEIYEAITEIYRADQRLPEWISTLEAEHPGDFARLALLGSLYEEAGDATKSARDLPPRARGEPAPDRSALEDDSPPRVAR